MRGLTKRWRFQDGTSSAAAVAPSEQVSISGVDLPPLVQRVLRVRGLVEPEEVRRFCQPRLADLCEPSLMPNIDAAAARLIDAVRRNELIAIYGDYDVDGITATAVLYHVIKTLQPAARLRTYVPHRLEEGYGINCEALRQLKAEGADLVISVDCGITALQSAQTARQIGLDLIVTDHHELGLGTQSSAPSPQSFLPHAVALVHPRLPGSQYPFGELCGAGVAFKLAWHVARMWCNSDRVSETLQKALVNMLPLVALGTIADVVPLTGENRILTAFGLRLIKQTPLVGLRALIEAAHLQDEKIDSERVGFALAPRLNACGRMGHAAEAVRLLTDASPDEAIAIARTLTEQNQHRQSIERRIFEQAAKLAEDRGLIAGDCRAIVLAHESWHPGVVGIVCSRMVERFGRPTVLLNQMKDVCKGSARSIDGYSIHEGISAGARFLTTFGGHAMAAGLTLPTEHLAAFSEAFAAHAADHIAPDQMTPAITIDCEANLLELDLAAVKALHSLAPFGRGNRAPTLLVRDAILAEAPKQIGSNGRHLALNLRQDGPSGRKFIRGVWWSAGERAADLASGMRLDLVIEPKLNEWNGRVNVEAQLHDLRICAPALAR